MGKITEGLNPAHEVEWVHVYSLEMKLCRACMKCRPDGECVLPSDDAHGVGRSIRECDALIVGTPTHWGNMSSGLKILFDRLVPALMGEKPNGFPVPRHKGKPAVVVAACSTPWPFNWIAAETRGAFNAVGEVLHYSGFKTVAKVAVPGTKNKAEINPKAVRQGRAAGRRLNARLPQPEPRAAART